MTDEKPKCTACGSTKLTPITKFAPTEGWAELQFVQRERIGPWLEDPIDRTAITRARACLSCGHAMLYVGTRDLRRLEEKLAELDPLPED